LNYMEKKTRAIIKKLANQIPDFKEPVHILAVCTGGLTLSKMIVRQLKKRKINAACFEVWANIVDGVRTIERTNFQKSDYTGTAVIVDDVIWAGTVLPPIKRMLKKYHKSKKFYIAALLDCGNKADFAVYR
jgi:hypoxanthine phosphoribosyltransferase